MMAAAVAYTAPAAPRPPDGTYRYRITIGGSEVGKSTVVISLNRGSVVVREQASLPQITATATSSYDPATLEQTSYAADVNLARGSQHTAVEFRPGALTVRVPGQSVDIAADPSAPLEIIGDNLVGTAIFIPAVLHAKDARTFTLAVLSGGKAMVAHAEQNNSARRPSGISSKDTAVIIDIGGLREIYWFDPATYVVDDVEIPAQSAEIRLTAQKAEFTPLGTPVPIPTALPTAHPYFRSENVTFNSSDGTRLAGTLTIPSRGGGPYPAVILVHGSGALDRDEAIGPNPVFLQLSNALSNAGYMVLRYDKRGFGSSGGTATAGTRPRLLEDVRAAYSFVRAQPMVNVRRVFLLGHSEGGELVPTVAANTPTVAGIILLAPPALPLWQISMEQALASVPPALRTKARAEELRALQELRQGTGNAWYRSSMDIDPATDIARVRCPILILQGLADVEVLPMDLPRLALAAHSHNRSVSVRLFSDDNHLFMKITPGEPRTPPSALRQYLTVPARIDPRVLQAAIDWLGRRAR